MSTNLRPNEAEYEFLTLAYNRFYDIFEEVFNDDFWKKDPYYRFMKIKNGFELYSELLNYEPIKWTIDKMKESRPPMESEISKDLFRCIRNIVTHFPFYDSWEEVWVNKDIVNWYKKGQSIDKFFLTYSGYEAVKYRTWNQSKKEMNYVTISFPAEYNEDKLFLKDIISEQDGVKFCFILMKKIMDTQVSKN